MIKLIYGSDTGNTELVIEDLIKLIDNTEVTTVADLIPEDWDYDWKTFTPTGYGEGTEDWYKPLGTNKYCPDGSMVPQDAECPEMGEACGPGQYYNGEECVYENEYLYQGGF